MALEIGSRLGHYDVTALIGKGRYNRTKGRGGLPLVNDTAPDPWTGGHRELN
jgi:hypothetical protein